MAAAIQNENVPLATELRPFVETNQAKLIFKIQKSSRVMVDLSVHGDTYTIQSNPDSALPEVKQQLVWLLDSVTTRKFQINRKDIVAWLNTSCGREWLQKMSKQLDSVISVEEDQQFAQNREDRRQQVLLSTYSRVLINTKCTISNY